jgi:DNA-binding FrmR family transcriptional regulator
MPARSRSGAQSSRTVDHTHDVLERLRRVEGQLRGIQRMIEEGQDCRSVVTQLSAVRAALDRAAFMYFALRMRDCLARGAEGADAGEPSADEMMEMFLKLA